MFPLPFKVYYAILCLQHEIRNTLHEIRDMKNKRNKHIHLFMGNPGYYENN